MRRVRLPALRPLPAHDGLRERRLRPAASGRGASARRARRSASASRACCARPARAFRRPLPGPALRRPAQRVALARALAVEPRVLLLDEPFGSLDAKVRRELRRWLRRLHDELHVTSVFVTHDQEEALEVADRVVADERRAASSRSAARRKSTTTRARLSCSTFSAASTSSTGASRRSAADRRDSSSPCRSTPGPPPRRRSVTSAPTNSTSRRGTAGPGMAAAVLHVRRLGPTCVSNWSVSTPASPSRPPERRTVLPARSAAGRNGLRSPAAPARLRGELAGAQNRMIAGTDQSSEKNSSVRI